jgi:hypothetical protein
VEAASSSSFSSRVVTRGQLARVARALLPTFCRSPDSGPVAQLDFVRDGRTPASASSARLCGWYRRSRSGETRARAPAPHGQLLELLSEAGELLFQVGDFFSEVGYFVFKTRDSVGVT